jgi:hypothetical protein
MDMFIQKILKNNWNFDFDINDINLNKLIYDLF